MAIEYKAISHDEYNYCNEVANEILEGISNKYDIAIDDINYKYVINYLISVAGPTDLCLFVSKNFCDLTFQVNKINPNSLKITYNYKFRTQKIPLYAETIDVLSGNFCQIVSGFTIFPQDGSIMFLNAETKTWARTIFTIIHELVHSYLAASRLNYKKQIALINQTNLEGTPYPEDLQLIEAETNTISSLLYAPTCSLEKEILKKDFAELSYKYGMSYSAMHNRLFNYFYNNYNFSFYSARRAVFAFRNENKEEIKRLRKFLNNEYLEKNDLLF
ncbi:MULTISPECIES: ImmA/IrrE family metallo-endopeptidase [unclassified Lactobacillus]|uniref:ImmA/IrrE family metallo-endopeptidase n=1 Tax=unclassified Lactobacillus TaxID=2620435 RepID=UPI00226A941F|nr:MULTISPECIES: ImmA/IrrE family metallo-endopeptidase [unclassified Lactobacillus]MCX8721410.1 ImmA/IrrE family metallo-endopeptidase [Lactobacillus sp. B4010]MCX8732420.1 ImmA/IrrE family metallo-endopeptidase [Lactobacillus sp. B4015]MCX8734640.1 ImmA/IrrE family metallo-endopeptidase [Lactobacillus sp. B4012]